MRGGLYSPRPVDDTPVDGQLVHGVTSNRMFDHEAALDAHHFEHQESLRIGEYFTMPYAVPNQGVEPLTADRLYAIPFYVARDRTFDRIAVDVSTAQAGSEIRLGIYNNGTNLAPGTLVDDSGTVDTTGTGIKTITISEALTKGLYWLAVYNKTGAVGLDRMVPTFSVVGVKSTDFILQSAMWYYNGSYGVLPNPFPAPTAFFDHTAIIIALRLLTND